MCQTSDCLNATTCRRRAAGTGCPMDLAAVAGVVETVQYGMVRPAELLGYFQDVPADRLAPTIAPAAGVAGRGSRMAKLTRALAHQRRVAY